MLRFIFLPLSILALLAFSCEKEILDRIAPTVLFEHLDGTPIANDEMDLVLGTEAEFTILIEDEANIRDISFVTSVNDGPATAIDNPDYLDIVSSEVSKQIIAADIPFNADEYSVGDVVKITISVSDPSGNMTVRSLTINITG